MWGNEWDCKKFEVRTSRELHCNNESAETPPPPAGTPPSLRAKGESMTFFSLTRKRGGVRRSREGVRDEKTYGGPVLRGIASAMHLRMRKKRGDVLVLASSQHAVDLEM
jgi:hypothetical protein